MAMSKIKRSDLREIFRGALKDSGLEECAKMKNKDLDQMMASFGDAVGEALRKKMRVAMLMHDYEGGIVEMLGLELAWKSGKKGYRKGQKYQRRPGFGGDIKEIEVEIELSDGTVMWEGKRVESKPDSAPKWGLKARVRPALADEVLPPAPKRKPK